ncbi:MAG: hypothetical protein ACI4T9_12770 [Prevotella sp.]
MTNTKIRRYKKWTPDDDDKLIERFQTDRLSDIAGYLNCGTATISNRARKLGLYKNNPTERNREAMALVEIEHAALTYKEIAQRTGLTVKTISRLAKKCGLHRSPDQWRANLSRTRKELYRRERARVTFGLNQRTRLKVVCNQRRNELRYNLKRSGYIISSDDRNVIYYPPGLKRHPVREQHGIALGMKFLPLPQPEIEEPEMSETARIG